MKIPRGLVRTTSKADWLLGFVVILLVLSVLTREIIFAAAGGAVFFTLVVLAAGFQRKLRLLRTSLTMDHLLSRSQVLQGGAVDGKLVLRNESVFTAYVSNIQGIVQKALVFELQTPADQAIIPGTASTFSFRIVPLARGDFQLSGYKLTLTDPRGLFTGQLTFELVHWIDTNIGTGATPEPLNALILYGGRPGMFYKGPAGPEYAGIREYAPGDEPYRVEWKATARLGKLMVKEFHPETEASVRILIDTGQSMRQRSYVGTRLQEALAIAHLLVDSIAQSTGQSAVLLFNETQLVETVNHGNPKEQLERLAELATMVQAQHVPAEETSVGPPRFFSFERAAPTLRGPERLMVFLRSLIPALRAVYRRTGVYKALDEITRSESEGIIVVLTDLQTTIDPLLEFAATRADKRVMMVVVQVGATWRTSNTLEAAYIEYQRNRAILQHLERVGITALDVRPEGLVDTLFNEISRRTIPA